MDRQHESSKARASEVCTPQTKDSHRFPRVLLAPMYFGIVHRCSGFQKQPIEPLLPVLLSWSCTFCCARRAACMLCFCYGPFIWLATAVIMPKLVFCHESIRDSCHSLPYIHDTHACVSCAHVRMCACALSCYAHMHGLLL